MYYVNIVSIDSEQRSVATIGAIGVLEIAAVGRKTQCLTDINSLCAIIINFANFIKKILFCNFSLNFL